MAKSDHPVIKSASAWASAEAALHPDASYSFQERLQALTAASKNWGESLTSLEKVRKDKSLDGIVRSRYFGQELHIYQAMAYIPSMKLAAAQLSGVKLSDADIETLLQQTKENLILTVETANNLDFSDEPKPEKFNTETRKVKNEILGGLLIQEARPVRYVVLPAPIRFRYSTNPNPSNDLFAYSLDPRNARVPIEASLSRKESDGTNVVIDATQDYRMHYQRLLKGLIDKEHGVDQDPEVGKLLPDIAGRLIKRIDDFVLAA